jgi:sterol desaturase/sphingolipid hydroxylase (fatty acid hydroxylase superfamily)
MPLGVDMAEGPNQMMNNRSSRPRIRLFRNDRLEALTLASPLAFAAIWSAMIGAALYFSWGTARLGVAAALVLCGLLIWSMFEYLMHRFLFHLKLRWQFGQRLLFLMHGNHHAMPRDPYRNIMPPLVSVGIASTVWLLFLFLIGPAGSNLFLGFAIGYVVYDSIHYACHQLPLRSNLMRRLRRHHIRHHYAEREGNYAITGIFWDRLFRTEVIGK